MVKELGSYDFNRVRLGIGRPDPQASEWEVKDYVLTVFKKEEGKIARKTIEETIPLLLLLEVCLSHKHWR